MPTKATNGKDSLYNVANLATKVNEESKLAVDMVIETTAKFAEDTRKILTANQEALEKGFVTWQEYNRTYNHFVLEATQQMLDEALTFRESLDKVWIDSFKKVHGLSLEERQIAQDVVDLFQTQTQTTAEYFVKMFTANSKMLTTTALFSDWATERAAKMFTTVPTN